MDTPMAPPPPGTCLPGLPPRVSGNIFLTAFLTLAVAVIVPLRTYTRIKINKAFWYDDAAIIIAAMLLVAAHGLIFDLHAHGLGKHVECVSMPAMLAMLPKVIPTQSLSLLSLTFSRISVAILLVRIFSVSNPLKSLLFTTMCFMVAFTIINIVLSFEQQIGLYAELVLSYVAAAVFVIADILLATIPVVKLRKLQLKNKQKFLAMGLLALGYITAICAIVRLAALSTQSGPDWTYSPLESMIATEIECSIAIICASIPCVRPLFSRPRKSQGTSAAVHIGNLGTPGDTSSKKVSTSAAAVSSPYSSTSLPLVPYPKSSNDAIMPTATAKNGQDYNSQEDDVDCIGERNASQAYWTRANALDVAPHLPADVIMKQVDVNVV